jgi:orotidine-5'-phosphate decarboxylase
MNNEDLKKKIIIALDVKNEEEAVAVVSGLKEARTFKVGLELFTAEGPALFRKRLVLDLKLHDIPNTVAGAVRSAVRHGIQMMTIHASGGREMMARAAEAARETAEMDKVEAPLLLGVTILTSLKSADLDEVGMKPDLAGQVLRLAGLAKSAGMDGIVCSPQEIEILRQEYGRDLLIVTPGIRPAWAAAQDQKRIMTPAEALRKGADYLVIGRPITGAASPQEAFARIVEELERPDDPTHRKDRS